MKTRFSALCVAFLLLVAPCVHATGFAMLQMSGIQGESADPAFPGWMELISLGLTGPLNSGAPGTFSFTKRIDAASPLLARTVSSGELIKEAKLVLLRSDPAVGSPSFVSVMTMSDLRISSFTQSGAENAGTTLEIVDLETSRIFFQYFTQDGQEAIASLSLVPGEDLDSDGIPDNWERFYGLPIDQNNAATDLDNDGLTDLQEYRLGTNPISGDTRFSAVAATVANEPAMLDISWDAVPGINYLIEWTPDLVQKFQALDGIHTAGSSSMTVRIVKSGPTGFFRVRPTEP